MSAKPYSEAEIAERRANPLCVYVLGQEPYPETMEQRWLATVDALKARLAAAEAISERAVGMVRRAYSIGYSAGCAGAPHSVRVDDLAALLKEVSHGR